MKRGSGNSLLVLGMFFIFFMLFLLLNHENVNITGMTVDDNEISAVQHIKILKLVLDNDGNISDTSEDNFESGDTLGCSVEYTGTGTLNIAFLAQGDTIDSPKEEYSDVLNSPNTKIINDSTDNKKIITATYKPLNDESGKWSCIANFNDINNASENTIEMITTTTRPASNNTNVTQQIITCTPLWDCQWGDCKDGKQTCAYYDRNNCNDATTKPQDLENQCSVQVGEAVTQQKKDITAKVNVESKNNVLLIPIILFALGVISIGVYLAVKKLKSNKIEQPINQNLNQSKLPEKQQTNTSDMNLPNTLQTQPAQNTNSNQMQTYIENAMQQGQNVQQIKSDLEKAGWNKQDIENTVNYCTLKKFVNEKKQQGFTKEKISESLKSKGWKDDIINKIFTELKI